MSDAFTIVMFVGLLFLFFIMAYGSGALDAYTKGYRIYVENLDRQLMASNARSEEADPDELLHQQWRGESTGSIPTWLSGHEASKAPNRLWC
ncbi:MAG: hypothetical protein P1Q69_08165 [Candidatus Thorarchaeota archaeon]|nr:hypothetical protein [Candidatus Thorarchaeota archaeon]